jgi:hypothetical protein
VTRIDLPPDVAKRPKPSVRQRLLQPENTRLLLIVGGIALILVLLLARSALDILVLLVLGGIVFGLERTVGDWLVDALGPFLSKVVFVSGVLFSFGVLLSFQSVRSQVWDALLAADELGFHSILINQLDKMPRAEPVQGDGVTTQPGAGGGGGGGGSPRPARPREEPDAPASAAGALGTRSVLRLGGQGATVTMTVDVVARGVTVNEGTVEFSVDGRRVASADVRAGKAEVRVGGVTRGSHRASARFLGTSRFGESVAEAAFNR